MELTSRILSFVNAVDSAKDLIGRMVAYLQETFGFEAVGVRLREGDDFPYYETRGFPQEFVLAEYGLCKIDNSGRPCLDTCGNPVLECMCGNVILGRFDPSKPFFTPFGSFWTNSTTELLASTTEQDRQTRTRNRCNGEGYESVGLFPLKGTKETFGLLQLNDRRKGRFSPEFIDLMERTAVMVAVALERQKANRILVSKEAEIQEHRELIRGLLNASREGAILIDLEGRILKANENFARHFGVTPKTVEGKLLSDVIPPHVYGTRQKLAEKAMALGKTVSFEDEIEGVWLEGTIVPIRDGDGRTYRLAVFARNINNRRRAEDEVKRSREELKNLARHLQHAREEERKQISRELHDQLGQVLTALQMELSLLLGRIPNTQNGVVKEAANIRERIGEAIRIVQNISTQSRPKILDELGLAAAVEWQVKEFARITGKTCTVQPGRGKGRIEPDLSTALFRILQEALTNVMRHAEASAVRVVLRQNRNGTVLEVRDNGKGIRKTHVSDTSSTGLIGMRERIEPWGGLICIQGTPNGGTTVRVDVPANKRLEMK